MSIESDLAKWLSRELVKNRGADKPATRISLRHASPGTKGSSVEDIDLTERILSTDDLPTLAEEIVSRAQTDADGLGNIQRYIVTIYVKGEPRAVQRFPFRIRANGDEFEEGAEEAPTMKGLTSQLMRHNEAMAKTLVHSVAGITQIMARRLESSDNTVARLTEQVYKNMELLEEAKSDQHARDMELLTTEAKETRTNQMFEKMAVLVPVIINRLAGQKVLNAEDPNAMMLKAFAESMTPEQFKQIQSTLKPEQLILLAQLMNNVRQLPAGSSNGTS